MMNIKGCFAVHSNGWRWLLSLTLMLIVFSTYADGQTDGWRVRRSPIIRNGRGQKAVATIRSKIVKDTWHEDPAIRSRAILALGRLYDLDETNKVFWSIVDALRRDKDKEVRWTALIVMKAFRGGKGGVSRGTVRAVQEVVATERDPDLRRFAAVALLQWVKLDKHTDKIWKYYLEMLQHPDRKYQDYALDAMYMSTRLSDKERMVYHKLHPAVRTQLEEMARAPQPSHSLVNAVSHIWRGRTTSPLIKWLHDEDYELRKTGALALERHSRKNSDAAMALLDTLRNDSSVKARAAAAKALTGHPSFSPVQGLERREFFPKMQRKVWNALVEAAQHDAPEVRASALLSLANLKEGDSSAWRIFTDAMVDRETSVRQKDERVKIAAISGLGQAIYLQFNESIEAVLLHTIENPDESYWARFHAVQSLLLFDYWDDLLHDVMIHLLSDEKLRLLVIGLWGEYAGENAHASRKLSEAFREMSNPQIRLYLAMALLKSGQVDQEAIEILVRQGLKDAKYVLSCVELLGRSGYSEPFVIEGLLEKLRVSLDAIGPVEGSVIESLKRYPRIDILYYGDDVKGSNIISYCVEALLSLDKHNSDLLALLPKAIYFNGRVLVDVVKNYTYGMYARPSTSSKPLDTINRELIRRERRRNR